MFAAVKPGSGPPVNFAGSLKAIGAARESHSHPSSAYSVALLIVPITWPALTS